MPSTIWSGKPRGPYPWNQRTNKQKAEDVLLARFQTEAERAKAARERYFMSVYAREKFFRLAKTKKAYDDYHRRRHAKRLKEEYAIAIHQALRTSWQLMADTDELTYQYPVEKALKRISIKNREEWLETQKELDKWDLKHEEAEEEKDSSRVTGKGGKTGKDKKAPFGPVPKAKDAKGLKGGKADKKPPEKILEVDSTRLPDPLLWGKEALAYIEVVKAKRTKELQDKFEAQQLERKERLEKEEAQRTLQKAIEEKEIEDAHWQREYGEEAVRMKLVQREAEEEEQKRFEYRQQMAIALMQERQAEWTEVTSRDHELLSMMREDYLDEVYKEWLMWEEVRKRKSEERKAKRLQFCSEIMMQMVTMMDIRVDHKAEFNSEISATNWRGWKSLFVQGSILPCPIFGDSMSVELPTDDPNLVFAKATVDDYLTEQGEWQGANAIGRNKELGVILAEIHGVADSPPEPPALPKLTHFKLKLAVVGTPYAGKTTVAKKLEIDFECVRIEMQNVIASAIELADAEEKVHKEKIFEEERKREEAEAQRILEEKQKIEFDRQQEALGLKDIYLRSKYKSQIDSHASLSENQETNAAIDEKKDAKSDQKIKEVKEQKADPKAESGTQSADSKGKNAKKTQKGGEKEKPEKIKKKGKGKPVEAVAEPPPEPSPEPPPFGPPPEPPHPLAYLTPKARHGMEIKLARLEGLQAPEHALSGLLLLTLLDLQQYADNFPTEAEVPQKGDTKKGSRKGAKAAAKKGAPPSPRGKSPPSSPKGKGGKKGDRAGGKGQSSPWGKKGTAALPEAEEKVLGFILDGFPSNLREAQALEWMLSGIDLDYIHRHQAKASKIAPPPEIMLTLRSGLDGYLLLQGIDENECLKRAMGKVVDEKTGKIYHVDYDPPPPVKVNSKEKGLVPRLKPVEELETARPKVAAGLESWAPLTQYLEKFVNAFSIAQQERDGKLMVDTIEPYNLASKFLDGWSKTQAAKVAAQAGLEAQAVASKAMVDAESANVLANEVAHKLWCAKLAEVETENGLDALGGDALAKQLIKDKASATVAQRLDEACKAAKEAREAAEAAGVASLQAEQRANLAKDSVDEADLEFAVHVKEEAEEAAEVAKEASIRADEAHQKAVAAFEAATAALLPKPEGTPEDKKAGSKKDKGGAKDSKEGKVGKDAKGSKDPKVKGAKDSKDAKEGKNAKGAKGVKGAKGEESLLASPEAESPVATTPTPLPIPSVAIPSMEKELAVSLHKEWESVEANYLQQLEAVFCMLHQEKAITRNHVVETIDQFVKFLQSRDDRQSTFDDFQEKWNRIETRQRLDRKFKPKLQAEVVNLDKKLKEICSRREKLCVELSAESLVKLLEARTASLTEGFAVLVQTELDRHLQTCSLLKEYYTKSLGSDLLAFRCALGETLNEPSEKFPVPGWIVTLAAPLPRLHVIFMKALSVAYVILDVVAGKDPEKLDGKGKKQGDKKQAKMSKTEPGKIEKKGKKGVDKVEGGTAVVPAIELPPPPLDPAIPPPTVREHEIFLHRLQRIAKVALSAFNELQPIADGAFNRMKEWSEPRLKAEALAVQEVVNLCAQAAEEQIPLWYRVYLDGEVFRVDESQIVLECPIKETTNLNLWCCKVLENLLADFKAASPQANYMAAGLARSTLCGSIMKTHVMFKDDLKESLLPRMPASKRSPFGPFQVWADLVDQMFNEIIEDVTKESKFVDWRLLLVTLVDAQFSHIISSASCRDILAARTALIPVATLDKEGVLKGPDTHGYVLLEDLMGIKLWFDSAAPPAPGEFDLGLALKIFLYNLFDEPPKGVHYQKLLLYLCRDPNRDQALQKAFNAVSESGLLSTEHHLTPEKVLGILYPGGIDAAWNQAIVPFILDDLYNLLYYVAKEKWDIAEREKESELAGSEESGSNDDTNPWQQQLAAERKAAAESTATESDRSTVEDFMAFAYDEFPELSQSETIKDFLCYLNIRKDPYGDLPAGEPYPFRCDVHPTLPTVEEAEVEEPDPYAIPETYTVQDIVGTFATTALSNMLYGNYGSNIVQLFEPVIIEDANPPESQQSETKAEKGKKKKGKDKKDKKGKSEKKK